MPDYRKDIGKRFNRLTVIRFYLRSRKGQQYTVYECRCSCGKVRTISAYVVRTGKTKSCGCLPNYHLHARRSSPHPLYVKWMEIRSRCLYPSATGWKNYGGRGIKISHRWNDPRNFINDMLPTWKPGLTLDRIDNDGNYTKSNCRWTGRIAQSRNKRNSKIVITPHGKMCLSEAVEKYGVVPYLVTLKRIKNGMDHWTALTTKKLASGPKPGPNSITRPRPTCPRCHYRTTLAHMRKHICRK